MPPKVLAFIREDPRAVPGHTQEINTNLVYLPPNCPLIAPIPLQESVDRIGLSVLLFICMAHFIFLSNPLSFYSPPLCVTIDTLVKGLWVLLGLADNRRERAEPRSDPSFFVCKNIMLKFKWNRHSCLFFMPIFQFYKAEQWDWVIKLGRFSAREKVPASTGILDVSTTLAWRSSPNQSRMVWLEWRMECARKPTR